MGLVLTPSNDFWILFPHGSVAVTGSLLGSVLIGWHLFGRSISTTTVRVLMLAGLGVLGVGAFALLATDPAFLGMPLPHTSLFIILPLAIACLLTAAENRENREAASLVPLYATEAMQYITRPYRRTQQAYVAVRLQHSRVSFLNSLLATLTTIRTTRQS